MEKFTVQQAKTQLSRLIQRALRGEEIIITNRHEPVVRLTAFRAFRKRLGFLGKGVWMSRDFNAPLKVLRKYQ